MSASHSDKPDRNMEEPAKGPSYLYNLPKWSLKNPTMVLLATTVFVIWGIANYFTVSRRESPEIKISVALVITLYPGASAQTVEERVTNKLEADIETMDNIHTIHSVTRQNISLLIVEMNYEVDAPMEWQKLRSTVAETKASLPEEIIGPDVWDKFGDTTGMIFTLKGERATVLGDLAEELKDEVRRVASVGDVSIFGDIPEAIYIEGTRANMAHHGINPYRLAQVMRVQNARIPGGSIQTDRYQFRVEPTGAFRSVADIENTIIDVSETTGQPLHVRDMFTVRRALQSPVDTKVLKDGHTAVALGVMMKRGFNIVTMGRELRQVLDRFRTRLPPGVFVEIVHDSPRQVNSQINKFMTTLLEGVAIVILVMAIFVGIRSASISAVAIPLSVLIGLAAMPMLSIDLEMVSITAFVVSLGMLVDDSIIVVDAVDIKLREGLSPYEAAWRGTRELTAPVVSGTLATVVAFLPMLLLTRETGAYVRSLPLLVSVSLLGSLLLSQTVTPLMAWKMLKRPPANGKSIEEGRTAVFYKKILKGCLRFKWLVVSSSLLALIGSGFLLKHVGFSFFPDADRDQFTVDIWLKEGSSIAETERIARQADALLRQDEDVSETVVYIGRGGPRFYITVKPEFQKTNYAQIMVNTREANLTHSAVDRFNQMAKSRFPGARVFAKKLIMGRPIESPVAFRIVGPDLGVLRGISTKVQDILRSVEGAFEIRDDTGPDVPSLKVDIDTERASRVGVSNTDVALSFLAAYQGFELTRFTQGDKDLPVLLRLTDDERSIQEDLSELPIASSATSAKVPLGNIATVEPQWGPGVIRHVDGRRAITVMAWNRNRLADDVVRDTWAKIQKLELEPGYRIDIAGEKEEMDRAFRELLVVFGVILAALIGLLVLQFGTLKCAFLVLLAVPFSVIGASVGLYVGGYSFSFAAFLGLVSLAGIVIKDSVVLVDCVERTRAQGFPLEESLIKAGVYRIRPILLTTVTTIGGLFPLALFGGVMFKPMANAMIGGMSLATVLTLIVIPIFYSIIIRNKKDTGNSDAP